MEEENKKEIESEALEEEENIKTDSINKCVAILSYLGILSLIPYYNKEDNDFIKFHAKEGMNLLLVWLIYYILYNVLNQIKIDTPCIYGLITCKVTPWYITAFLIILGLFIGTIAIVGIINVLRNEKKHLPFITKIKVFK